MSRPEGLLSTLSAQVAGLSAGVHALPLRLADGAISATPLLMAVASTMLTVPMVAPRLETLRAVVAKSG